MLVQWWYSGGTVVHTAVLKIPAAGCSPLPPTFPGPVTVVLVMVLQWCCNGVTVVL
jgi:hypothetical protein